MKLASQFDGKFRVPTLRNVDKRPRPDFVKAYMHNGYLKSLKEVVHFYNTRMSWPVVRKAPRGEGQLLAGPRSAPDHGYHHRQPGFDRQGGRSDRRLP